MVKNIVERLLSTPFLFDTPGDGGAGGGGTGDGTPGAVNDGAAKPGEGTGKPDGTGQPDAGGRKAPVEDPRIKGLLEDLKKERLARQRLETTHGTTAAELERERKRVLALSGIEPKSKEEEDEALIRERLERLYPWLKDMTPEDIKAIRESRGQMDEIRNASVNTWKAHANKMLGAVTSGVQKALGGKLSERQKNRIEFAYAEEARGNPEFLARHEAGDQTLIEEFVKGWLDDFVEPGRRSALAQETQTNRRPRVPGGKDRSIVGANEKPIDVKDDKAVEDMLVASFIAKGGRFGRR